MEEAVFLVFLLEKTQVVRKVLKPSVLVFSKLGKYCIAYDTDYDLVFVNWVIK